MMSTNKLGFFVFVLALVPFRGHAEVPFQPNGIAECLKRPTTAGLAVLADNNPYYLRGDFDGDGKPDYVVVVRSQKRGGAGVLVCAGSGLVFLLGSGISGVQFSDMAQDRFIAPQWAVFTKLDVKGLKAFQANVPRPVPPVKAESIAMIWEDGICLIYWDGTRFKWAGSKE